MTSSSSAPKNSDAARRHRSPLLRALPHLLLRLVVAVAASVSLAHAAGSPAQLDSPKLAAKAPAGGNRTLAVAPATQGRRIALVIGNADYQYPDNLPRLANPANDAHDIAAALRGFGFEVIERKNQTLEAMHQTIAEFGSRIGGSEAALFYFAGHGIQVKNQNYLMPVDAKIDSEAAVPYKGVDLNRILDEMDNAKSSANIVMLDACRNNPISGKFRSGKSRGLASPGGVPKGTVIVYATDPGNTAADGDGRNGLFTAGLLTAFKGKNLSLDDVLTVASAEVERVSGQTQSPYVNGPKTLQKNFHFRLGGEAAPVAVPPAPTLAPVAIRDDAKTRFGNEVKTGSPVPGANPRVAMTTSQGSMIIELYQDKAPGSVENFLQYVRDGFFNGTVFHRVIDDFMIQGGGFTPDMRQKDTRAPIRNEAANGLKNEAGTLAMARKADPHSANAQFFINLKDNATLDYPRPDGWGYAVFGKVVQGLDTVQRIAKVPTGNSGQHQNVPSTPVVIQLVNQLATSK